MHDDITALSGAVPTSRNEVVRVSLLYRSRDDQPSNHDFDPCSSSETEVSASEAYLTAIRLSYRFNSMCTITAPAVPDR